jgi:hypothetical protein
MLTLLTGNTWYGKYGFRPIKIENNKYIIDNLLNNEYEKNLKKMNNIKISDFDFIKYIKKTYDQNLIKIANDLLKVESSEKIKIFSEATEIFIKRFP